MRRLETAQISTTPIEPGRLLATTQLLAWLLIATGLVLAYQAGSLAQ